MRKESYLDQLKRSGIRCHYFEELYGLVALDEGDIDAASEHFIRASVEEESEQWTLHYLEHGLFLRCCASGSRSDSASRRELIVLILQMRWGNGRVARTNARRDWNLLKSRFEEMQADGHAEIGCWDVAIGTPIVNEFSQNSLAESLFGELQSNYPRSVAPLACLIELKARTSITRRHIVSLRKTRLSCIPRAFWMSGIAFVSHGYWDFDEDQPNCRCLCTMIRSVSSIRQKQWPPMLNPNVYIEPCWHALNGLTTQAIEHHSDLPVC